MRFPDAGSIGLARTGHGGARRGSNSPVISALFCLLFLWCAGCAAPRLVEYLPSVQGTATQADVKRDIGPPLRVFPPDKSGDIWIYRELTYSHNPPFGVASCVEYVLTFNRKQILQEWTVKEWPPLSCR